MLLNKSALNFLISTSSSELSYFRFLELSSAREWLEFNTFSEEDSESREMTVALSESDLTRSGTLILWKSNAVPWDCLLIPAGVSLAERSSLDFLVFLHRFLFFRRLFLGGGGKKSLRTCNKQETFHWTCSYFQCAHNNKKFSRTEAGGVIIINELSSVGFH